MTRNIMMNDVEALCKEVYHTHQRNVQMPEVVSSCADGVCVARAAYRTFLAASGL